jgi:hypothetical protein
MVSDRKQQRRLEFARVQTKAKLKKAYSLSFGLLLSDAAFEKFQEEWLAVQSNAANRDKLKASKISAAEEVQTNSFTRAIDLLAFHLGALYAVVEKWKKWKFIDAEVNSLLKETELLKILEDYRHTVFHVDRYDAKGTLDMLDQPEILSWTRELSEAIRRALRNMIPKSSQLTASTIHSKSTAEF